MIRNFFLGAGLCMVLALGAMAQQKPAMPSGAGASAASNAQSSAQPQLQPRPRYEIQRSDVFTLTFPLVPEYNQTVTVEPDGYITLTDVGEVYVLGKTMDEVSSIIQNAYAKILKDPIISINLTTFVKPYFIVLGQVNKPGQYDLKQDVTVTEALALAGGLTRAAKHSSIVLFHHTENGFVGEKLNVKRMLSKKNLTEDMYVQPGDLIWIPTSFLSKLQPFYPNYGVNVVGANF